MLRAGQKLRFVQARVETSLDPADTSVRATVRRLAAFICLVGILAGCLLPGSAAFGQEERRRTESPAERRAREAKSSENPQLGREGDRLGREGDRLGKEEKSLSRETDRLDRKSDSLSRPKDARSERGFRSREEFENHYQKHQAEYGKITREEYLKKAQGLRDTPADGKNIKEIQRGDDRISKYDTRSNDFGVYERDGTVVTFFRPKEGERYFHNQAEARK